MTQREDLESGITSLEFRLVALSAKLAKARKDDALELSHKINTYGRTLDILNAALERKNTPSYNAVIGTGGTVTFGNPATEQDLPW